MVIYKAKSLTLLKTDEEIKQGPHTVKFISFMSIVDDFQKKYDNEEREPIGYRVTSQGIEIIYE